MSWFVKKRQQKTAVEEKTVRVPEGLWIKCEACKELIYRKELVNTHNVCPKCGYHFRIGVEERLENLMDEGWTALFSEISFVFWNTSYARDGHYMNIWLGPQERQYVRAMQDFAYRLGSDVAPIKIGISEKSGVRSYVLASPMRLGAYLHHFESHDQPTRILMVTLDVPIASKAYWYSPETAAILKTDDCPAGKKTLTVTTVPASKTYGSANPAFSAAFTGLVPGDDASVLGGNLITVTEDKYGNARLLKTFRTGTQLTLDTLNERLDTNSRFNQLRPQYIPKLQVSLVQAMPSSQSACVGQAPGLGDPASFPTWERVRALGIPVCIQMRPEGVTRLLELIADLLREAPGVMVVDKREPGGAQQDAQHAAGQKEDDPFERMGKDHPQDAGDEEAHRQGQGETERDRRRVKEGG